MNELTGEFLAVGREFSARQHRDGLEGDLRDAMAGLGVAASSPRRSIRHPTYRVARYGGEEFAMLLPQCQPEFALALAESSRQRVKALKVRDRRTQRVILTVTISAGVACLQAGDDAQGLVARADEALYAARQAGRDRVCRL